jgi:transcriptional regulator with XRE-family HTH domain
MNPVPPPEPLPIAVRAFASPPTTKPRQGDNQAASAPSIGFSDRVLVFDTETTTDASQRLRFGVYQVRESGRLHRAGLFYDPLSLTDSELTTLRSYAADFGFEACTVREFVEAVFFPYAYELRALCVGLNLPFDLSRLAIDHDSARGKMRGGFSLKLSENKRQPRVQVKHLSNRSAFIRFAAPAGQRASGSSQNGGKTVTVRRGHFVDVRTLAGALLGGSWSLGRLAGHLEIEHKKLEAEGHGETLTEEYLGYAVRDVQATWECFERLKEQYKGYGLTRTPIDKVYSEASLGKAYLNQMGVKPWRELQLDFPPDILGAIVSAYYGGRSEVRIRRKVTQILYCDFLSMYPTVCTLMGLWSFVIAKGVSWQDATEEVHRFLGDVTLEDLQKPESWPKLCAIVRIRPNADVLPVRASYGGESQYAIGLNRLTSDEPLWYTLADCAASKILTGEVPEVLEALRFEPFSVQEGLGSIDVAGNAEYHIDPYKDDFYKRLIDLRSEVKGGMKAAKKAGNDARVARLDAEQEALKLCANATSYGIFMELNVSEQDKPQEVECHGAGDKPFPTRVRNVEEPGRYFHPVLATLITGGARLLLTISERLAGDSGIGWAFCDTDSMALAKPENMDEDDLLRKAERVSEWFAPLNPYERKVPLFKLEDANYGLEDGETTDKLQPLFVFAVSAKRYALFNLDGQGRPVLRKASAHGLGHLLPPYTEEKTPRRVPEPTMALSELGVQRWQHNFWYRIVEAALGDAPEQVQLDHLPGFEKPAVSRYSATTPNLLRWFDDHNSGKPYRDRVKPFNFLLSYQPWTGPVGKSAPRPVSAYDKDPAAAADRCFDRERGDFISPESLKTYREALAQYHLHPEAKFHGGDYLDSGFTHRRHVRAMAVEHIGKEANRWEEQFHLGLDLEAQTQYGPSPEGREHALEGVRRASKTFGQRKLARAAGVSLSEVSAILRGRRRPTSATQSRLYRAVSSLQRAEREEAEQTKSMLDEVRRHCKLKGLRHLARRAGIDPANLTRALKGRGRPSQRMLTRLQALLAEEL